MSTKFQNYITNDDSAANIYGANWESQTFTTALSHTITSVKLLLYRVGSPGTVTVGIRGTTLGVPSGANVAAGTYNGDTLTDNTAGAWVEITLGAGALLSIAKYAIVVSGGADASNKVMWRVDASSPTYSGGSECYSSNSGVDWTENTYRDFMFEEWGDPAGWQNIANVDGAVATDLASWCGAAVADIANMSGADV